jgi:hypothetical protein
MSSGLSSTSYAVLGNSEIKTPYDIKPGMKMLLITIAEEPQLAMLALCAWGQVNPNDITWVPVNNVAQMTRMLMDGVIDLTYANTVSPGWYEAEAAPSGLRWIPLDAENDPEGAERYLQWSPSSTFGISTGGVPSSEGVPMVVGVIPYITRADSDPELVYRIVKWMDENYDRFKDGSPWAKASTIDNLMSLANSHYEPIHDGAVRYLEEKGLWTEELEARNKYNIEQMTLWVEAYQTAINMADKQDILVSPDNDEWQEFWESYRQSLDLPLLSAYQGPGKEQPIYWEFYETYETARTEIFNLD